MVLWSPQKENTAVAIFRYIACIFGDIACIISIHIGVLSYGLRTPL